MSQHKPRAGICDVCGSVIPRAELTSREQPYVWVSGHLFVDGKLAKVRCRRHLPDEEKSGAWLIASR